MAVFVCLKCNHSEDAPDAYIGRTAMCIKCKTKGEILAHKPEPPLFNPNPIPNKDSTQESTTSSEPLTEPLDGIALIGVSVVASVLGGVIIGSGGAIFGFVVLGIAGMLYLAGVIRWALSGSKLLQLNRLAHQNAQIIELLKVIAEKNCK